LYEHPAVVVAAATISTAMAVAFITRVICAPDGELRTKNEELRTKN
jgi:hypothetical protein